MAASMTPALTPRFGLENRHGVGGDGRHPKSNFRQFERSAMTSIITEPQSYASLSGLPKIDIPENLNLALAAGRSMVSLLHEIIALWRGPGKLSPQEYFYCRLWDPAIPLAEKRRFVGKKAQYEMHLACNSQYWYGAAADKSCSIRS
jgi:hypothetical protein